MGKFLRASTALGAGALTIVLVREAAKNDFFTSKTKTYFGRPDDKDNTGPRTLEPKYIQEMLEIDNINTENLTHTGILTPLRTSVQQMIEAAKQYTEVNDKWEPLHMANDHGVVEEKLMSDSNVESEMKSEEKMEDVSVVESATITGQVPEMVNETTEATDSPKVELLKEDLVSRLEKEDSDSKNVVDVKVAFSNDQNEKVLDPKLDFSSLKLNFGGNNTLNNLGKSCMDLGIVLGDLMADVPDAQPRLNQVYRELETVFENVSNLQKEQDDLISKALQEQGSEFSQVLEQQWESSVNAMTVHALELEKEYSEKLDEFKTLYTNQMQQEEKLKLENIRKEYETEKSNALLNQEKELKKSWEAIVEEKLDQERDGRLAKLDYLNVKVQVLQNVTEDIASRLEQKYKLQNIEIALENLSKAISNSPHSIEKEFERLWLAGSKYPFISTILTSLPKDLAVVGVPEYKDLVDSFLKLRKDISRIRYMPENGGVISYLISSFGPRSPIGEITGNVLENSYEYMSSGDIDSAARQINRLRGWQRVLALDWLSEARRYLELKQALDVIHDYVKLEKLEVL